MQLHAAPGVFGLQARSSSPAMRAHNRNTQLYTPNTLHTIIKHTQWALPLEERLTMLPFLTTLLDYKSTPEVFEK